MFKDTSTIFAWYYVGVAVMLLIGQNALMSNAHKDQMAKQKARYEQHLAAAGLAPLPAQVAAAPAAPATAKPATASTAPAASSDKAAEKAPEKAEIAKVEEKKADEPDSEKGVIAKILASAPGKDSDKDKPTVPVALAFRSEPFEKGKIVLVTNKSKNKLACMVNVKRPATGKSQTIPLTVAPAAEVRLTGGEHWAFKSGDQIEIAHSAYETLEAAVP